jgi:hypothetical protein
MSLQTDLRQRRDSARPAARVCVVVGAAGSALVLNTWQTGRWAFPWSYFLSVHHQADADGECLHLAFTHHEVVIAGRNLAGLVDDLAAQRIESLSELPERFSENAGKDEPRIWRMVVRSVGGLPQNPPSNTGPKEPTR